MIPLPSLRWPRSSPPGADHIIDLSEAPSTSPEDHGEGEVGEEPEANATAEPLPDAASTPGHRRTRMLARLVGLLTLRPDVGAGLNPAAAVFVAWAWLMAWVVALSLTVTAVFGHVTGGSILQRETFIDAWRLVNLMPVASAAGPISLVPMLPALLVLGLIARASGWLWRRLWDRWEGRGPVGAGVCALAGSYLLAAMLIATSPTAEASDEGPLTNGWPALVGLLLVGIGATVARDVIKHTFPRGWLLLRAAGTVLTLLLAASFLLVIVQLLLNWSQFWDMSNALLGSGQEQASRFDAAALGALQLGYLPNVVVWTAAYLVGAGFSVGVDTIVSPFSVNVGTVPELPLTTLLPVAPLPLPWLPLALVALGSMGAGSMLRQAGLAKHMRARLAAGIVVALVSAVGMALLSAAANGGLGAGRLVAVGPVAGASLAATFLVVGLGMVAWAVFPTLIADVGPFVDHARQRVRDGWRPTARSRRRGETGRGSV